MLHASNEAWWSYMFLNTHLPIQMTTIDFIRTSYTVKEARDVSTSSCRFLMYSCVLSLNLCTPTADCHVSTTWICLRTDIDCIYTTHTYDDSVAFLTTCMLLTHPILCYEEAAGSNGHRTFRSKVYTFIMQIVDFSLTKYSLIATAGFSITL